MTSLCRLLLDPQAAAALEADLSRLHGVDLRDLWRYDVHGRRCLTLRRVVVFARHLPPHESVLITHINDGEQVPDSRDLLLMQVWSALTGEPHPSWPTQKQSQQAPDRERKLDAARARARERERRIAAGEIT